MPSTNEPGKPVDEFDIRQDERRQLADLLGMVGFVKAADYLRTLAMRAAMEAPRQKRPIDR